MENNSINSNKWFQYIIESSFQSSKRKIENLFYNEFLSQSRNPRSSIRIIGIDLSISQILKEMSDEIQIKLKTKVPKLKLSNDVEILYNELLVLFKDTYAYEKDAKQNYNIITEIIDNALKNLIRFLKSKTSGERWVWQFSEIEKKTNNDILAVLSDIEKQIAISGDSIENQILMRYNDTTFGELAASIRHTVDLLFDNISEHIKDAAKHVYTDRFGCVTSTIEEELEGGGVLV